jgi:16S rRNA (guanine527-N7)-methyltransferase
VKPLDVVVYLTARLAAAGISATDEQLWKLASYFRLLARWNSRVNLTGFDLNEPSPAAVDRLLFEPLVAATFVSRPISSLIDVGSGGGSPAIPMAIALGNLDLTLVEARSKKAVFLREALRELGIESARVVASRHEEVVQTHRQLYAALTARAVRLDRPMIEGLSSLVRPGGRLYLFRGGDAPPLALPRSIAYLETRRLADLVGSLEVLERLAV